MKKNITYKLFFIVCIQGLLGLQQSYAATYYVSPTGSDSNSGTALSTPVKTITKALSKAQANGDIVYVTTGTYAEAVTIEQSGITLSAYLDNKPVIDGGSRLPNGNWGALIKVNGNNNAVSGFEVKNSNINGAYQGGYGVWVVGHHNTISKVNVHHIWENGIFVQGDYGIVEDSTISQSSRTNSANPGTGWSSGLSAARNASSAALKRGITSYAILRRNTVFNNWGEGLSCFEADHCTMEDNIVYDNYTVNLYLSDSPNSLVQRNMVYVSANPAIPFKAGEHQAIVMADEVASVPRSANSTIINNFIYNADLQAFYWTLVPNSGLNNVLIANNTIVDGSLFTGSGGNIINTNSQIRNNIIVGKNSDIPSNSGITFSHNNWSVMPSAAAASTNIVGDPQIARTGATTAGALTSAYFKISGSSPVTDAAMPLNVMVSDFFKGSRGTAPDIGAHEFGASSAISNTSSNNNTADSTVPLYGTNGAPSGYTWCADESGTCSLVGTVDVAYGANGSFYYKYGQTGSIGCNNGTFGDPINDVAKSCYVSASSSTAKAPLPSPVPEYGTAGAPSGYTWCADEAGRCSLVGTVDVAYGANGSFYYKYGQKGGIGCNNRTFGDPISGVVKSCYVSVSSN
ncbi:right-handed parallel beta-helix repeat-containing protein [Methylobacter sp. G7]|uniref:right-handed parallel beta-helix repeat-containing protein n=1 Tax=Methylobacter sp. G7 TaxID=3230117 RepID=UPI003D804F47